MNSNATAAVKADGVEALAGRTIAKMRLEFDDAVLKDVIRAGQLREFTGTVAALAAAHISAQIVDKVADMAIGGSGRGVGAAFILEGGDFGTVPPKPKWGVGPLTDILQRFNPATQLAQTLHR
ncbi:MAG: hypothetical protein ACK4Z0_09215 [Sphingomonadaceae bacterium]